MLQKLENFYLTILRVVAILVSGAFLVAVVILGMGSLKALQPAPEQAPVTANVDAASYKTGVIGAEAAGSAASSATSKDGGAEKPRTEYLQVAKLLSDHYAKKYNSEGFRVDALAAWYAETEKGYADEALKKSYAAGLLERVSGLIADPDFSKWEEKQDPESALTKVVSAYKADFDERLAEAEAKNRAEQEAHAEAKAKGLQNLYFAAIAFGMFLLIVFISIIIRIERNLRPQSGN